MAVVGIDLGTTNTVIAAVRDGRATSLKDKAGRALLPSVVSFGLKGAPKVGYPAKDRRTIDPENTIFSIKRLIGRTFESEQVQKSIARYPFKLSEGPGRSTLVSCHGETHTLPEISAFVLQEAVTIAEQRLGERVSDAVITVPANFNDLQRAATKIAGRTAGLEVLRIINEPTAAALAYGFGQTGRERIVVYDFGGGTFDVTLLDLNENVFEVLSTAGDTFLGGDDVDGAIMDRMAENLLKEHKIDAEKDILVREQLRSAAETLKIDLSTRSMAKIRVEDLEFEFIMRRSEFEALIEPLMARTLSVCQEALDIAGVFIKDIDQVLLVGGSTRIPLVRRRVSSFFSKMPQSRINPDEVVAIGAAIQASSLEAKQAPAQIPGPPRPRGSSTINSPLPHGPGTTKTGLAGLGSSSVLSGLKSLSISTAPGAARVPTVNPAQTLSGVGSAPKPLLGLSSSLPPVRPSITALDPEPRAKLSTLSGVGHPDAFADLPETKGSTNLGLGQAPGAPPPQLGEPPPRAVVPIPARTPQAFVPLVGSAPAPAERSPSFHEQLDALPSAGVETGAAEGDGSVTFDLGALEASEEPTDSANAVDEFGDETTEIFDKNDRAPRLGVAPVNLTATARGGSIDPALLEAELPVAVSHQTKITPSSSKIEELSDSALFMLVDDDTDSSDDGIDDLPAIVSGRSPSFSRHPQSTHDDELDLPSTSRHLAGENAARDDRDSDLPLPVVHAPGVALPAYQSSRQTESTAQQFAGSAHPQAANLPSPNVELPAPARKTASPPHVSGQVKLRSNAELPSLHHHHVQLESLAPDEDEDEGDDFVFAPKQPVGLSTQPGGSFDPSFPARSLMDSVSELDELSKAPLEMSYSPTAPAQPQARPAPNPRTTAPVQAQRMVARPLLLDVTPLSLGVEVVGGYVDKLIERNSPVPCQSTRTFATSSDNQSLVRIRVSQGEEGRFEQNTVLGEVLLSGLVPGPRGSVKINVSFSLDESGMLHVTAHDPKTGAAADARLALAGIGS